MNSGRCSSEREGLITVNSALKCAYRSALYLMGSPMWRTIGLTGLEGSEEEAMALFRHLDANVGAMTAVEKLVLWDLVWGT